MTRFQNAELPPFLYFLSTEEISKYRKLNKEKNNTKTPVLILNPTPNIKTYFLNITKDF